MTPIHTQPLPMSLEAVLTNLAKNRGLSMAPTETLHRVVARWYQDRRPVWNRVQASSCILCVQEIKEAYPAMDDPVNERVAEDLGELEDADLLRSEYIPIRIDDGLYRIYFTRPVMSVLESEAKRCDPPKHVLPQHPERITKAWQLGGTPALAKLEREIAQRTQPTAGPARLSGDRSIQPKDRATATHANPGGTSATKAEKAARERAAQRAQKELF